MKRERERERKKKKERERILSVCMCVFHYIVSPLTEYNVLIELDTLDDNIQG